VLKSSKQCPCVGGVLRGDNGGSYGIFFCSTGFLGSLASDPSGELDILWHDGHTLGVNSAQVGVLEKSYQVSLAGLLKGADGCALKPEISFEILSNLSYESLEGQFANKQLGGFLVTPNFTKGHGTGTITMGFLDSSGGRSALPGSLGGQLFPGSLSSGRFTSGLLCTSHDSSSKFT